MALQSGRLIHDENHNVHYNGPTSIAGKANAMNSQRKTGITGRKPLGDLSNSRMAVLNQSSKRQTATNLTFIDEESGAGKKKNVLKGSEKVQKGTRKVLSDISNSGKPSLIEASKKKQNLKLSTMTEEPLHHKAIGEERFLHNHQECFKAQNYMDMDQFLRIVGLDAPKELGFTKKPVSLLKHLELEEMVEYPVVDRSPFGRFDSSPPCKSPKSPSIDLLTLRKDSNSINFMLMKTP